MRIRIRSLSLDTIVWISLGFAALILLGLTFWLFRGPDIIIANNRPEENSMPLSALTGLPCENPDRRPVAVMLASDPITRPLSGLEAADIVFEMPVTPNGITRMMAVYQCGGEPEAIGSVRSAREDFIPLAQGLKAIYAHWGGEHSALERLNNHVIDNINALVYEFTAFYRKKGLYAPHNGFTNLSLLRKQADKLGYPVSTTLAGYPHEKEKSPPNLGNTVNRISLYWPQGMDVQYAYNLATNTYARSRGGKPEIDATTGAQVHVSVVIVMNTTYSFMRDQYISVRTTGQGTATIYQNGRSISGFWEKQQPADMLIFKDANGKPIPFTPGRIWVEIDPPLPGIR